MPKVPSEVGQPGCALLDPADPEAHPVNESPELAAFEAVRWGLVELEDLGRGVQFPLLSNWVVVNLDILTLAMAIVMMVVLLRVRALAWVLRGPSPRHFRCCAARFYQCHRSE